MSQLNALRALGLAGAAIALGLASAGTAHASRAALAGSEGCGRPGYSYAGYESATTGHGIAATLSALWVPTVRNGHAAAWVGVGGAGADAWIQVGLVSFPEGGIRLYVEITQPGSGTRYREVVPDVRPGTRHRLAVLELAGRPNWWRALVDRRPASSPVYLGPSGGRWHPIATAESWDGGTPTCNRFEYRFESVAVARANGGAWRPFVRGFRLEDPGYRVLPLGSGTSFLARAAGATE
jgi:hypothetical protein